MARTRFIRLAGVGLLLAAAIQIVVQIVVTSGIFVSTAIPLYSLKPL